jgi:hypothetical protein
MQESRSPSQNCKMVLVALAGLVPCVNLREFGVGLDFSHLLAATCNASTCGRSCSLNMGLVSTRGCRQSRCAGHG